MDNSDIKVLFGNRIRALRKLRGWSQEEFALRVNMDWSYVGGVERGERNISLENICRMSAGLGVPTSELFECWTTDTLSQNPS